MRRDFVLCVVKLGIKYVNFMNNSVLLKGKFERKLCIEL